MDKLKKKKTVIILLFVLVTLIWGSGFPIVKMTLERGIPEFFIMASRFTIAAIALFIIKLFAKKSAKFKKREAARGSICGVILFLAFACQTYGLAQTSPAKSGILTGCYVVFVPLLVLIFTKRFSIKPLVDAIICLFGMMVFFDVFSSFDNIGGGDWLTIGGALLFAVHMFVLEKASKNCDALDLAFFQMLATAVLSWIVSLSVDLPAYATMDWQFMIVAVLYLGVFSTGFAYLIQTLAQENFSATTVSMVACLEAVFATLLSIMFGMEVITPMLILGACYIIFSVLRAVLLPPVVYDRFL